MRILAVDPSTKTIGWCMFDTEADRVVEHGAFSPGNRNSPDAMLANSYRWMYNLAHEHQAGVFAIEIPILATYRGKRNAKAFRTHSQLVGVLRVAAYPWTDETIEVLPSERLTALGLPVNMKSKPAKEQVCRLVNILFGLELTPEQHDISDAVAVALAAQRKLREREMTNEKER